MAMSWKTSIPLGVGIFLAVVAVGVIGAGMFLSDKGEEMLHMYKDFRSTQQQVPDPSNALELQGRWRGMTLAAIGGPTAQILGIREAERGVVVADLPPDPMQAGGLAAGDVIVGVDQQPVDNIADLYNVSRTKSPVDPLLLDVRRHNHALTVVLPGLQAAPGLAPPGGEVETNNPWGAGMPAAWTGQQFYCPREGLVLPGGSVSNPYLCPRCQGPLHLYPRGPMR